MGVESAHTQQEQPEQPPRAEGRLESSSVSSFFWSLTCCSNNTSAMAKLIGCKVSDAESDSVPVTAPLALPAASWT